MVRTSCATSPFWIRGFESNCATSVLLPIQYVVPLLSCNSTPVIFTARSLKSLVLRVSAFVLTSTVSEYQKDSKTPKRSKRRFLPIKQPMYPTISLQVISPGSTLLRTISKDLNSEVSCADRGTPQCVHIVDIKVITFVGY